MACLILLFATCICSGLHTSAHSQMKNGTSDSKTGITGQRRTDDAPAAYYWNKQTDQFSAKTNVERKPQAGGTTIEGHGNRRSERAVSTLTGWFLRQWKHIISNAKLVKRSIFGKAYQKNGDYNTALADFNSLKPTNVRNTYFQGEIKGQTGWVGDTKVKVREPTQRSREVYNVNHPYLAIIYSNDAKLSTRFIEYIDKKGPSLR